MLRLSSVAFIGPSDLMVRVMLLEYLFRLIVVCLTEGLGIPVDIDAAFLNFDAATSWALSNEEFLVGAELLCVKLGEDIGVVGTAVEPSYNRVGETILRLGSDSNLDVLEDALCIKLGTLHTFF